MPEHELEIVFEFTRWVIFQIWFWSLLKNQKMIDKVIEKSIRIK
jgi:hypothetical protein